MAAFRFELLHTDEATGARLGRLHTPHGPVDTPAFMPVGTAGAVKAVRAEALEELGAQIILANTYHLYLRPGAALIAGAGGLHGFAAWPHPILTDSGGFQVFSLRHRTTVDADGVTFRSHLDGSPHRFTPELATGVQMQLGADIFMAFDECVAYPAEPAAARAAVERTIHWAQRCRRSWEQAGRGAGVRRGEAPDHEQALFGIVQGGMDASLRQECAARLVDLDLSGYAIGGLSVGEPRALTRAMVEATLPQLPADKPRYLMGVGTPGEIVEYARMGVDLMDCVLPTRNARNGLLFTSSGRLAIKNAVHATDSRPPDPSCGCSVCRRYSRAYLRHLFQANEIGAAVLASHHNLYAYLDTMRRVRHAIAVGKIAGFQVVADFDPSEPVLPSVGASD